MVFNKNLSASPPSVVQIVAVDHALPDKPINSHNLLRSQPLGACYLLNQNPHLPHPKAFTHHDPQGGGGVSKLVVVEGQADRRWKIQDAPQDIEGQRANRREQRHQPHDYRQSQWNPHLRNNGRNTFAMRTYDVAHVFWFAGRTFLSVQGWGSALVEAGRRFSRPGTPCESRPAVTSRGLGVVPALQIRNQIALRMAIQRSQASLRLLRLASLVLPGSCPARMKPWPAPS